MGKRSRRYFLAALPLGAGLLRGARSANQSAQLETPLPHGRGSDSAVRLHQRIATSIGDSHLSGSSSQVDNNTLVRRTQWTSQNIPNASASLVERWTRTPVGFRCEIEIMGERESWSAPICVSAAYPAKNTTAFWTPWDHHPDGLPDKWSDPMVPAALRSVRYTYGAPRYTIAHPGIPWYSWEQRPHGETYFSVPVFTWIESAGPGCSIAISPEPVQLDLEMSIEASGRLQITWYRHRFSSQTPVKLAFDIVHHGNDCREGLGWMVERYPEYFHPPNPAVHPMAGTGAYSVYDGDLDRDEMRRMAFSINWRASFDFPYMGMFLPPVSAEEPWISFRGVSTSQAAMEAYCARMKAAGFHVLSYFNVTEFGTKIHYPPAAQDEVSPNAPDWRDPNQYLFSHFATALLHVPSNLPLRNIQWPSGWEQTRPGGLFYTWEKGVGVDPGEPVYAEHLVEQVRRHLERLPSSSGFCIDRLDWLRFYNLQRDDAASWFENAPARSMLSSWFQIMERLAPIIHAAGKVIFVNPIDKRLDTLKHVDGLFDEMADHPAVLNGAALAGICKPVIVWRDKPVPPEQVDEYFQRLLYLGVFPMCPYPHNDHGLDWGSAKDRRPFTDYGPLLAAVRGRKWILKGHAFEVKTKNAKANLFSVADGYAAPIVFGTSDSVEIDLVDVIHDPSSLTCEALHPGVPAPQRVETAWEKGVFKLKVPLRRGCAVVRLKQRAV